MKVYIKGFALDTTPFKKPNSTAPTFYKAQKPEHIETLKIDNSEFPQLCPSCWKGVKYTEKFGDMNCPHCNHLITWDFGKGVNPFRGGIVFDLT